MRNHRLHFERAIPQRLDRVSPFVTWERRRVGHETTGDAQFLPHHLFDDRQWQHRLSGLIAAAYDISARARDLNRLHQRLRYARDFEREINAIARELFYFVWHVYVLWIKRDLRAQRACNRKIFVHNIRANDLLCAKNLQPLHCHQSDGTRAEHHDSLPRRKFAQVKDVARYGGWLDERGVFQR
jgi:hypothetical protein